MQPERFYEAMAKWVVLEADLWNVDSFSRANFFFGSGTAFISGCSGIASERQRKAILALQKHCKVSSSSAQRLYTFVMVGGENR